MQFIAAFSVIKVSRKILRTLSDILGQHLQKMLAEPQLVKKIRCSNPARAFIQSALFVP